MVNKIALFLLISLTSQFSLASCPLDVTYLPEGAITHCKGYLFTPDAEKRARQDRSDAMYYEYQFNLSRQLNDKQAELNKNLEDQINVLGKITEVQANELTNTRNNNKYYALGGAILAIILYNNVR